MGCSREGRDDLARLNEECDRRPVRWNYRGSGEPGRSDWAVHVAQLKTASQRPEPLLFLLETLSTDPAPQLPAPHGGRPKMVVGRPERRSDDCCRSIRCRLFALGSAGAKAMAVVLGHADIMLTAGVSMSGIIGSSCGGPLCTNASRCDGSPPITTMRTPSFQTC